MTLYELATRIDALLKTQTVDYSDSQVKVRLLFENEYLDIGEIDVDIANNIVITVS